LTTVVGRWASRWAQWLAAASVVFLFFSSNVTAQTPSAPSPAPLVVKWNNGLDISTADGANDFQIGTLIELDGRFGSTIHCTK